VGRRLVIRVGFSLLLCVLVGVGLTLSADGARWAKPDVAVVTTSAGTVEGRLRGTSPAGVELLVADQRIVIPWSAVVRMSLKHDAHDAASAAASADEGASRGGRI
jgi:hypothetical protein